MTEEPATIVNADDFGHRAETNAAIAECFRRGWISSTTIMANMPGFEEACQVAADHGLAQHVGLHFVLTEGRPLTGAIRRLPRFCDVDGRFVATRKKRYLVLSREESRAVAEEFRAQVDRCRTHGLPLTHVDSHHHIHEEAGILAAILPVLRECGIPHVRIMNNLSSRVGRLRRTYTACYNALLRRRGLARTRYFGDISQFASLRRGQAVHPAVDATVELMVHPETRQGQVCDKLSGRPVSDLIGEAGLPDRRVSFSGAEHDG